MGILASVPGSLQGRAEPFLSKNDPHGRGQDSRVPLAFPEWRVLRRAWWLRLLSAWAPGVGSVASFLSTLVQGAGMDAEEGALSLGASGPRDADAVGRIQPCLVSVAC